MKPGAPWSVKGIRPEARETAKSAARRAGMTLGEWLNQTIGETGLDAAPVADPMRAPEDWKRETGKELPWTRPIETMSAEVAARLATSQSENSALLSSLESAIGGISKKLIALDNAGRSQGTEPSNVEARLIGVETRQKRALSKDHLKSLETAVGQISVVMDSQAARDDAARQNQKTRIDQSQKALVDLAAQLEQTEDRVNQALSSVEAAAELYDITDKQGQMIDSLVMDVAAVQAEQKNVEGRTDVRFTAMSSDIGGLRAEVKAISDQSAELAAAQPAGVSEDARLAVEAIAAQISTNEEKSATSVSHIEAQITGLSELLDRSLLTQQSGIEDLRGAVGAILQRLNALEDTPQETVQESPGDLPDLEEPAAQTLAVTPRPPVTFRTTPQQSTESVHVNLAVTLDQDLVRTAPVIEPEVDAVALAAEQPLEEILAEDVNLDLALDLPAVDEDASADLGEELPDEDLIVEISVHEAKQESELVEPPILHVIEDDNLTDVAEQDEPAALPPVVSETAASQEDAASLSGEVDTALAPHRTSDDTTKDEPLSFNDIFGTGDDNQVTETLTGDLPVSKIESNEGDADKDAALKEAVTNISTMRASWAARNEAQGKPGSMRQIVEVGDEDTVRRGWAMTAGGLVVVLGAISGVLVYSGETSDLIDARQRPGLFDQMISWVPGRAAKTFEASTPKSNTIEDAKLPAILAALPAGLEDAARDGDARAQFALGRAFANGDGRPVDKAQAVKWYEAAAGQGLAIAQYVLASLHERGIDVAQNKDLAMDWYAAAARGGNRRSMHNLAVAYARGDVITQDLAQAAYWFSEAAALGLSDAQYNLALLHERGLGVDKDAVTALKWYQIAAASGDQSAQAQAARLSEKLGETQRQAASGFAASWQAKDLKSVANGLFDISPSAWDNAPRRAELATIQSRLLGLGYTIADQDGIMDPVTRTAIKKFQSEHGQEVTGTLTPGLYESLTEPGVK